MKSWGSTVWIFLSVGLIVSGCVSGRYLKPSQEGIWYELQKGENINVIASYYKVPALEIQKRNEIIDPEDVTVGMILLIPKVRHYTGRTGEIRLPERRQKDPLRRRVKRFIWPVGGTISSGFGLRHGHMHEGIDITGDKGKQIRAAATGVVSFSGRMRGYGNTVVIDHGHQIKTLYGHNARNYVRKGQQVRQGQKIAKLGSTGHSTGPHLHFEVQINNKPRNPLRYLPLR